MLLHNKNLQLKWMTAVNLLLSTYLSCLIQTARTGLVKVNSSTSLSFASRDSRASSQISTDVRPLQQKKSSRNQPHCVSRWHKTLKKGPVWHVCDTRDWTTLFTTVLLVSYDKKDKSEFSIKNNNEWIQYIYKKQNCITSGWYKINLPEISENLGLTPPPTKASRLDRCSMEHRATLPTCSWSGNRSKFYFFRKMLQIMCSLNLTLINKFNFVLLSYFTCVAFYFSLTKVAFLH